MCKRAFIEVTGDDSDIVSFLFARSNSIYCPARKRMFVHRSREATEKNDR